LSGFTYLRVAERFLLLCIFTVKQINDDDDDDDFKTESRRDSVYGDVRMAGK